MGYNVLPSTKVMNVHMPSSPCKGTIHQPIKALCSPVGNPLDLTLALCPSLKYSIQRGTEDFQCLQ